MQQWICVVLVVLAVSGCSLVMPGDFAKDHQEAVNVHIIEYEKWIKKKGIAEEDLIGKSRQEIRRILGRPSRVNSYHDDWDCPQQIRDNHVTKPICLQEAWVYTNWYGIPYLTGGFCTYVLTFENDRVLKWEHPPWQRGNK